MTFFRSKKMAGQAETVAQHRIIYSDGSCRWSQMSSFPLCERDAYAHEVRRGKDLEFDIVAPAAGIERVEVRFGTFGRVNRALICADLFDGVGRLLARHTVDCATISDNAFQTVIEGPGLDLVIGAKYRLRLSSPDGLRGNCVAAWVNAAPAGYQELSTQFVGFESKRAFVFDAKHDAGASRSCFVICPASPQMPDVLRRLVERLPDVVLAVIEPAEALRNFAALSRAEMVIFANCFERDGYGGTDFDSICFELHRRGVVTVFFELSEIPDAFDTARIRYGSTLSSRLRSQEQQRRRCHFSLIEGARPKLVRSLDDSRWPVSDAGTIDGGLRQRMISDVGKGRLPHLAIVTVLYRKADVIEAFLDHVVRQTYPGPITVVMVDDLSPEDDACRGEAYAEIARANHIANREFRIIRNSRNQGNCGSRHVGIQAIDADLYVVMDCDCLINRDFVAAHVFEHWFDDVDVVIGPLNIETGQRDGAALVRELEADPTRISQEAEPQDPVQLDGFTNCITRNLSFKRRMLERGPLFDLDFSYSTNPDSGFGWEDVEMGYRFYQAGAVIRFTPLAFAVHCSHASSMPEDRKAVASMRNFARLFEKHPELALVARRWGTETYGRIANWADREGAERGRDRAVLDGIFGARRGLMEPLLRGYRPGHRRLRVLTYRWHVPHQYELYKLPHDFTLAMGFGNGMVDQWAYDQRPMPPNVSMIPFAAIDPAAYDVAILHFDENVLAPHLTNGVIPSVWGAPFRYFLNQFQNLPKVAVCHGTPQFEGQYGLDPNRKLAFDLYEDERHRLVRALSDAGAKVVCNSHQAASEWGFAHSRVIWQGFDPQQFPKGDLSRQVLALEPDRHRPHYRGAWEHEQVQQLLESSIRIETARHLGAAIERRGDNAFAVRQFRSYVDRIGRFSVYLNTTLRSPMPRSRGEAMMTGVIPVCLRNHDVDMFIENGVDGFYAETPELLANFINDLFRDTGRIEAMSKAARAKAMDVFNHDQYLLAWTKLLEEAIR